MWKYHNNYKLTSYCPKSTVATFYNSKNIPIFDVFAGTDCYYTKPRYSFILPYTVSYSSVINDKEELGLTQDEVLLNRLKKACEKIEANYARQVYRMKSIIW